MNSLLGLDLILMFVPFFVSVSLTKAYIDHRRKSASDYVPPKGLVFSPIVVQIVAMLTIFCLETQLPLKSEQDSYAQVASVMRLRQFDRAGLPVSPTGDASLKAQMVASHMKECLAAGAVHDPEGVDYTQGLGRVLWQPTLVAVNKKPEGLHSWGLTPDEAAVIVEEAEKKCSGDFLASIQERDRSQVARLLMDRHYAIPEKYQTSAPAVL